MMRNLLFAAIFVTVFRSSLTADKKCQNGMFEGRKCASTGSYSGESKGFCGCGRADENTGHWWVRTTNVGAVNEAFFRETMQDTGSLFQIGSVVCGDKCGKCFNLTATGGSVKSEYSGAPKGASRTIMIVDMCPRNAAKAEWCGQTGVDDTNDYGYKVHFDLQNLYNQLGDNWDHPEVTYELVDCNEAHYLDKDVPESNQYSDCQCSNRY